MKRKNGKLTRYLREFWKYRDLLVLLVQKDIKLKYRRSWLGYIWSILNPLLVMLVMTVVFSTMFSRNIDNFPVYLFCGQLLFNYMNNTTRQAIHSISSNSTLLKKTYLPKYMFTVSKTTSGLVDLVFSLGALIVVLIATQHAVTWHALLFPIVLLQLYLFTLGLGLFLAQANVFFKDTQFIYNAVTTAWLYVTPIFYPLESLPEWLIWLIKHFNPMYFYVGQFRDLIYYGQIPGPMITLAGWGAALGMLLFGTWTFFRSKDRFILHI